MPARLVRLAVAAASVAAVTIVATPAHAECPPPPNADQPITSCFRRCEDIVDYFGIEPLGVDCTPLD